MQKYNPSKIEKKWSRHKGGISPSVAGSTGKLGKYRPEIIEKKWQRVWTETGIYKTKDLVKKPKFYALDFFPYPSGEGLHVGHTKGYIATDVASRKKMLEGYNILHPMGWDAFGLPTENYAIKHKIHPKISTEKNIANFKKQFDNIGFTYDWSREINTTDPEFYKWTQWIFLKMFERGLAYESDEPVNWCPSCKTVLANEDLEDGRCERCGTQVTQKKMRQWVLKMTAYADRLLYDLDSKNLDWEDLIKKQQKNWIGRSEGAVIKFQIISTKSQTNYKYSTFAKATADKQNTNFKQFIEVFTTRLDTIFGCTYCVIAPEHPLIKNLESGILNLGEVKGYVEKAQNKTEMERTALEKEKTGVELKGIKAINPFTNEEIPVWVADYVLGFYGAGAVMAVPAHDERDFEFAKKYNLPFKAVIIPQNMSCIIVHGCPSKIENDSVKRTYDKHWMPWLKKQLSNAGISVSIPLMPEPWKPDYKVWKKEFEKNEINESTVLIGHSCGTAFLVRWLGETKRKINKMILVAPWKIPEYEGDQRENLYNYIIDSNVKDYVRQVIIFTSDNEENKGKKSAEIFQKALDGKIIELKGKGHYTLNDMGTEEFFELLEVILKDNKAFIEDGKLINSKKYTGLKSAEAREEMTKWLEVQGIGKRKVNYKMRDWVFSRQRYWGEPIPLIFCPNCKKIVESSKSQIPNFKQTPNPKFQIQNLEFNLGEILNPGWIVVPEKDLLVKLPKVKSYEPTGTGESPLAKISEWVNVKCPKCGAAAKRETNTMPQWAGSSWYYLRYIDPKNKKALVDKEKEKYWMPVDLYVGGAEHATRHLLYARFWHKFLYDIGIVSEKEPFKKLVHVGLINGEDGRKMSKRWGNVINPDDVIAEFGADTLRLYEMFMGPFTQNISWSTKSVNGMKRFLERVWGLQLKVKSEKLKVKVESLKLERLLHKTIKKVTEDIENFKFNTAISALMVLSNEFEKRESLSQDSYSKFMILLSPFAPHIAEELWSSFAKASENKEKYKESIFKQLWPKYNPKLAQEEEIELIIQVNGKVRDRIKVAADISENEAQKVAMKSEKIKKAIDNKQIKKVVFVKGRLVNIVM